MTKKTYAFIDGVNVYLGVKIYHKWKVSTKKLRIYLRDKYNVSAAFYFISDDARYRSLVVRLQQEGYIVVTRPSITYRDQATGKQLSKGNIDADLVLRAMIEYDNYDDAVLVSGDGDFFGLIQHWKESGKLKQILIPNSKQYSCLYDLVNDPDKKYLSFIDQKRSKLEMK